MSSIESFSDIELMDLLKSGDRNAFSEIYSRYWKKLFAVAANKTGQGFVRNYRFGGEIERNLSLLQVLKILEKTRVHFRLEGREVVVMM